MQFLVLALSSMDSFTLAHTHWGPRSGYLHGASRFISNWLTLSIYGIALWKNICLIENAAARGEWHSLYLEQIVCYRFSSC